MEIRRQFMGAGIAVSCLLDGIVLANAAATFATTAGTPALFASPSIQLTYFSADANGDRLPPDLDLPGVVLGVLVDLDAGIAVAEDQDPLAVVVARPRLPPLVGE